MQGCIEIDYSITCKSRYRVISLGDRQYGTCKYEIKISFLRCAPDLWTGHETTNEVDLPPHRHLQLMRLFLAVKMCYYNCIKPSIQSMAVDGRWVPVVETPGGGSSLESFTGSGSLNEAMIYNSH